jgi:hypothetical protein
MMEWQFAKDGYSTGEVTSGASIAGAMRDLCAHVLDYVLPRNEGVKWDHLLVDISWDSGQFVVLPMSAKTPHRIEKVGCQLVLAELAQRFQDLIDSEVTDDEFERRISDEEMKYVDYFLEAARETKLRGVRVIFTHGGGDAPLQDVVV